MVAPNEQLLNKLILLTQAVGEVTQTLTRDLIAYHAQPAVYTVYNTLYTVHTIQYTRGTMQYTRAYTVHQ